MLTTVNRRGPRKYKPNSNNTSGYQYKLFVNNGKFQFVRV